MRRRDERGTGVVGTTAGFAVALGFLLVAVQVAVALYARTTGSAIAFDQARRAAAAGAGCPEAAAAAEAEVVRRLGGWWRDVDVAVACGADEVVLRVDATASRSLVPQALARPTRLAELRRTVLVRREALR